MTRSPRRRDDEEDHSGERAERDEPERAEWEGFGQKIRVQGRDILLAVVLAAVVVGVLWIIHVDSTADSKAHEAIIQNQREFIEQMEVQNWLLSMPQERRPALRRPTSAYKYLLREE